MAITYREYQDSKDSKVKDVWLFDSAVSTVCASCVFVNIPVSSDVNKLAEEYKRSRKSKVKLPLMTKSNFYEFCKEQRFNRDGSPRKEREPRKPRKVKKQISNSNKKFNIDEFFETHG